MPGPFTAAVRENPGRQFLIVDFRHPLKNDANNRPGKKVRKGLGTADRGEADRLVAQLNELLRDESLWSVGARPEAARRGYNERVLDIFYAELESTAKSAKALREQELPLPDRDSGYSRHLLLGVPGSGKTTIDRQFTGAHPKYDAFPATSVNRTTTFPIETICRNSEYTAVVSFLSEHETRFEIEESVSAAIIRAATDNALRTAKDFLEQSDMRFRLKYVLGEYQPEQEDDLDPYADPEQDELFDDDDAIPNDQQNNSAVIEQFVNRIWSLSRECRQLVEQAHGSIDVMDAEDRSGALDLIQAEAEGTDEYAGIVSDVLEELRDRFGIVNVGRFEKTTTGWPRFWRFDTAERKAFYAALRFFAGISSTRWGRLLTPLVNGIRVAGPFKPSWVPSVHPFILFDTEGLGHKAGTSADVPGHVVGLFNDVDSIILVHSAKTAMDFSVGKALQALVSAGQTKKTIVVFTHMDDVHGPNLRGSAKKNEHAFNNLRNIVEHQLAKSLPTDVVRFVTEHLEHHTFYLGKLNDPAPTPAYPELRRLTERMLAAAPTPRRVLAFPRYNTDHLVLSIREAAETFRLPWRARLGLDVHPQESAYAWQSIKAMTRRYAEGFDDGYPLRPASNLLTSLSDAVSRFLETTTSWDGDPTPEEKRETIDIIKAKVSDSLRLLSARRLREQPQPQWHSAYTYRGTGSTRDRRNTIEAIYARWVPIPSGSGDVDAEEFLEDVKGKVLVAIDEVRQEVEAQRAVEVA
jgi:hypothetical protein